MIEAVYEGYGPGGVAIMLETLSDNRNRTVSAVRTALTRAGGNLAEAGAVSWQFEKRGVITIEADDDEADDLALVAIDAGAEDVDTDDSILQVYSEPSTLEEVRSALESSDASISSSEVSLIPSHTVTLDTRMAGQILRLLDQLEEIDDVQQVYSNADFPDEALANYEG